MCFSSLVTKNDSTVENGSVFVVKTMDDDDNDGYTPILPGLPDDISKHCLALVPRHQLPAMGVVCKRWRLFIRSKEFITVRKLAGIIEERLYVLTADENGKGNHWEVIDCLGNKLCRLPPMPSPAKSAFGTTVLDGKLVVLGGYAVSESEGTVSVSADGYQYDSFLNSWSKLPQMNVARYDFACAVVNGKIYVAGGCGANGDSLSSVEVYDPDLSKWMMAESLRRPRRGCFACGVEGNLYVMGGRSNFTIGNSRFVEVYSPESQSWCQMKNGCVMVTAHAVLGKKVCCMEWKNERKLVIFDPARSSWTMVPIPVTGSSSIGFRFGILNGKLLLFSLQEVPGYQTLIYDPEAEKGDEWKTCGIKPSGPCVCSLTIKA